MPKIKPERITGVVALSYLVLIPAGAIYLYNRLQSLDKDVTDLFAQQDLLASTKVDAQ